LPNLLYFRFKVCLTISEAKDSSTNPDSHISIATKFDAFDVKYIYKPTTAIFAKYIDYLTFDNICEGNYRAITE